MKTRTLTLCCSLLLCMSVSSCGKRKNDPVTPNQANLDYALEMVVETRILPAAAQFSDDTTALQQAAEDFCGSFSEAALSQLQQTWLSTNNTWYRLDNYRFGPLYDDLVLPPFTYVDSLRLRGTQYIATVRTEHLKDMTGEFALSATYYNAKPFQLVGLLALESIIFETTNSPNSKALADIVSEYQLNPRKCETLSYLSDALSAWAQHFRSGWTEAYKGAGAPFKDLFLQNQLPDGTPALTELLTSVQEYLDYLHVRNVITTATPVADNAWEAIASAITEIELLLNGSDNTTRFSFFAIMRSGGYEENADEVQQNIDFAHTAIAERDITNLQLALTLLDGNFKRQIPDGLNVSLGINFSDGD